MRPSTRSRTASSMSRRSTESSTRPGMMLMPPGLASICPTVPTVEPVGRGLFLDDADHLRRRGQGVAARAHGRRPRVPGLPGEREPEPHGPGDARHDADRKVLPFEHPPLLDVELEVRGEGIRGARGLADPARGRGRLPHGLGDGDAVPVLVAQDPRERVPARARLPIMPSENLAPSSSVKATTSTGRSVWTPPSSIAWSDLDAAEHPERPVEVAAVVHGVHVGANEDRRGVRGRSPPGARRGCRPRPRARRGRPLACTRRRGPWPPALPA